MVWVNQEVKQYLMEEEQLEATNPNEDQILEVIQAMRPAGSSGRELGPLISYRKDGSSTTQYVSDLYLQQRINAITQTPSLTFLRLHNQAENTHPEAHTPRYFEVSINENQSRFARCFKCGTKGHLLKHCPKEERERDQPQCLFCLGEHSSNNCNIKTCFQCNQTGHMARECRAPRVRCCKCGNKGHLEEECGVIMFLNSSGIRFDHKFRERYGLADIMKVRCLANCRFPMGHFNCHQYDDVKGKFYPQASRERSIVRQRYLLSNVNKLRESYFKQAARNNNNSSTGQMKVAGEEKEKQEGTQMSEQ